MEGMPTLFVFLELATLVAALACVIALRQMRGKRTPIAVSVGETAPEEAMRMNITLTKGGKKLVRFIPLNKFGLHSAWDSDGLPAVNSSTGPATLTATTVDFSGNPFPADQNGEWFVLASNGAAGESVFQLSGDGHTEAEGEPESVKDIAWTVTVNAVAADVETVTSEESEEIPE